jgi:Zn-dependent protease
MSGFLERLPEIIVQLLAFALALSVHESAHGWMAERLGDPTARWLGRISLNPLRHVDLFGTVLFPLLLAVVGAPVIGWAKPVPFVTRNLRNQRWGPALVALAGPVSNLLVLAGVTSLLLVAKVLVPDFRGLLHAALEQGPTGAQGVLASFLGLLFWIAAINLILAVFNLIPVPPLDGSHVLFALAPARWSAQVAWVRQYGMILLFLLLWTRLFDYILRPFLILLQLVLFW